MYPVNAKPERLLTMAEVIAQTAKSRSAIYNEIMAGKFPRPLKRGRQSVWVESEVQAVIAQEIQTLPRMGQSMGARRKAKKKPLESAA
jgi:prophage regulatory protein